MPYPRGVTFERTWKPETVLVVGAGLMASLSLGMLVNLAVHHFGPDQTPAGEKFFNFVVGGLSFHGAGLILSHFFLKQNEETWRNFLGWGGPRLRWTALLGAGVAVLLIPITHVLNELAWMFLTLFQTTPQVQPTMQVLQISVSLAQRISFGITAILVAPLVEEILFRGILYRTIKQTGRPLLALVGSSLLFGAIHANLMTLLPLSVLAVVLALLYDKTGNLLAPIIAHALFNAVNFFMFLLSQA